ncbi:MAG: hypothetical protein GY821_16110 [Gammaproteobacteria bacterium]|nr:hypothetical protein [Gammaproteobacteria bacterium]
MLHHIRLESVDVVWPMPITLDVDQAFAEQLTVNDQIVLRDFEQVPLAILTISDIWRPDKGQEALSVFKTQSQAHPAVNYLFNSTGDVYLGGKLTGLQLPCYYDFTYLRYTPRELRNLFITQGWQRIVAFQTRNPMHRAHQELTCRAAALKEANLLIHPVVGMTKPGDVDHYTRVRCYEKILKNHPEQEIMLSLLPLAMRMGGPREGIRYKSTCNPNFSCQ